MDSGPPGDARGDHGMYRINGAHHKVPEFAPDMSAAQGIVTSPTDQHLDAYTLNGDGNFFQNRYAALNENESAPLDSFANSRPLLYESNGAGVFSESEVKRVVTCDYFENIPTVKYEDNDLSANPLYGAPGFIQLQNMYKDNSGVAGYVDMLDNGNGMVIKKEKPDYDQQYCPADSQAADMPYPPNTCVTDWNHYNTGNGDHGNMHLDRFPVQNVDFSSQPVFPNQMFPTHSANEQALSYSNQDIHVQSREITQNIISSTWGSDSLHKSQMYGHIGADTIGSSGGERKRKLSSDRETSSTKSRRRRTSETVSKSSTAVHADANMPAPSIPQHSLSKQDANELNSEQRNSLVTTLMNNLRSTVQYESFCLSLPRREEKEAAFRRAIQRIVELVSSGEKQHITSNIFPEKYVKSAQNVIASFEKSLCKDGRKLVDGGQETVSQVSEERSAEQVEEQMPHSLLWAVRLNDSLVSADWEGQILATVNPRHKLLCLNIFQYVPEYSAEAIECLQQARLTKEVTCEIIENMEQFEISRQLRLYVDLTSIDKLYMYAHSSNQNVGCLILQANKLQFHQRWLHTNADSKNQWRRRGNFLTETTHVPSCVYFGGLVSELNELVALMLACCPDLHELYSVGTKHPFQYNRHNSQEMQHNGHHVENGIKAEPYSGDRSELRDEIIDVLIEHGIVSEFDVSSQLANGFHERGKGSGLDIRINGDLSECFRDYVNHGCCDSTELLRILQSPIRARSYGFAETDFDLDKLNGRNIDTMSVAELIISRSSEVVYYSFCRKEVGQLGHDKHCSLCRRCNTWRYWHCSVCDRCSEGGHVCQYCGHLCDEPTRSVIKPLSVFRRESATGDVKLDGLKDSWIRSLSQSDTDVLYMPPRPVGVVADYGQQLEYNAQAAMTDELGLLNPVGFLLGQRASGTVRKHRRHTGKPTRPLVDEEAANGSQKVSGCNLQ